MSVTVEINCSWPCASLFVDTASVDTILVLPVWFSDDEFPRLPHCRNLAYA